VDRKSFIQLTAMCGGSILASNFVAGRSNSQPIQKSNWVMPDESAPHKSTAGGGGIHCTTQQEI
jgi:hypothetical protein